MTLFEELKWRGLIQDISNSSLEEKLNKGGMTFYIGTDPTADSLHIGHFSSFLLSKRLKEHGHNPILLIGGATALIGDPKPNAERGMISKQEVLSNVSKLSKQASDLFGFEVVNNYDWCKSINFIDFLRDYGKYFGINYMLDKDIIRRRLDSGITYTEFSYMIIQALDFEHLYSNRGCTLQVAGSDQWGNITSGIELIRKKHNEEVFGFTMPLVTKSDGVKFGKTESGTVWLDCDKTSPYELYQFFLNSEDTKVIEYLKRFTFLGKDEIDKLEVTMLNEPHLRLAQKTLASEVVSFIHGKEALEEALRITDALFLNNITSLNEKEFNEAFKGYKTKEIKVGSNIVDILVDLNIAGSKREAREFISNGAITINGKKCQDLEFVITSSISLYGFFVIRKGKKNYYVVKSI